jgi:hypothetical protein
MYYFMLEQFAREEVLNSAMIRLRAGYLMHIRNEEKSKNPNGEKIEFCKKRCKEITSEYRTIFNQTDSFKEDAIKKYSKELNKLNPFS